MSIDEAQLADVQKAGFVRRRLLGGYGVTIRGRGYLRDACARHEALHAELSKQAEKWESGAMTKREKREALVDLVLLAWQTDEADEAEAVAELRSFGFDPYEALRRGEKREAEQEE